MDDNSCSICLNKFKYTTTTELKCGHKYHSGCLSKWTRTFNYIMNTTCPLCRETGIIYPIFEFKIWKLTIGYYGYSSKKNKIDYIN